MAVRRVAAGAKGEWLTDVGEQLYTPHPTGGYDHIQNGRTYRRGGLLHREDGPAVIWPDGTQLHYEDGKLHREDGPAVHGGRGPDEWWREGRRVDVAFDDAVEADDEQVPVTARPVRKRRPAKV